MFTDIVGYTALTQANESKALQILETHNQSLRPLFAKFRGREVKTIGDSFLVEFESALDATLYAVEIQEFLHSRNATVEEDSKIRLRIGIHLGDVIYREGDIFGDAVNIASRIQPLADPEGICISEQVYFQVRNKVQFSFHKLETPEMKNVKFQLEVYSVILPWTSLVTPSARTIPDKLRIAVLPFTNISSDPNDEYFADGMTEELIDRLAQMRMLKVIARTSVMTFKKSQKRASEIAKELGAGIVVEGSVRKAGNKIRATVQLIDAASDDHLWSSSYDRQLDDVFAIQSDIALKVAEAVSASISGKPADTRKVIAEPAVKKETTDMVAYTLFLQARHLFHEKRSIDSIKRALDLFNQSVQRDPRFANALVGVAECLEWLAQEAVLPFTETIEKATDTLGKALSLDPDLAEARTALALMMLGEDDLVGAAREARRAMDLNPSLGDPYRILAQLRGGAGKPDEMVSLLESAYQIDPLNVNVIAFLGRAYFYAGREKEALEHWDKTVQLVPYRTYCYYGEYYLSRGDLDEAEDAIENMERIRPDDPWNSTYRGYLEALRGDTNKARAALAHLEGMMEGGALTIFLKGFVHFALGEMDEFYECMKKADELHSLPVLELMYSPLFSKARGEPRYVEILSNRRRTPGK